MTTSAEVDPNAGLGRESLKNALVDSGLGINDLYIYIERDLAVTRFALNWDQVFEYDQIYADSPQSARNLFSNIQTNKSTPSRLSPGSGAISEPIAK